MQHGVVPQNLHFTRLPDEMAEIETQLFVPQAEYAVAQQRSPRPRRAAVSSYGFSGTNVHAIVEQAPERSAPDDAPTDSRHRRHRCCSRCRPRRPTDCGKPLAGSPIGSTRTRWTLRRRIWRTPSLAGVRTGRCARRSSQAASQELTEGLREVADGDIPYQPAVGQDDRGPVWVFSGQGSQWAAMGAELLATEPVFAATVAEVEPLIARESGFSVTEAMSAPETVTGIDRIQPDPVHHAGRAGRHDEVIRCAAGRGHRPFDG